jgi:hypothetical protein
MVKRKVVLLTSLDKKIEILARFMRQLAFKILYFLFISKAFKVNTPFKVLNRIRFLTCQPTLSVV